MTAHREVRRDHRGSRMHVLDWVEQPGFLGELQALIGDVPCRIRADAEYMPRGHQQDIEARADAFGRRVLPESGCWDDLRRWWLRHPRGANTPNWDLAVGCEVRGTTGLLLVEAKANVPELSRSGKARGRDDDRRTDDGRQRSAENLVQISAAIEEARLGLEAHLPGISLGVDSHYQLSNRLAFAWKLASCGVPCVLMYLGFTEDTGLRQPLRDDAHWRSVFADHLAAVCPSGIPERSIDTGAAELWVLCRSKKVARESPPPVSQAGRSAPDAALGD